MAGETGGTINRLLNKLQYALANDASANSTVAATDRIPIADVSDDYEVKYSTAAEIGLAAGGGTAGTVVASRAVVVDANKDISSFRNLTATRHVGTVQTLSSGATATAVNNFGYTRITSVAANTYELAAGALVAGAEKWIVSDRSSGTANVVVSATAAGITFNGTNNKATFNADQEALHLVAISTAAYMVLNNIGAVSLS